MRKFHTFLIALSAIVLGSLFIPTFAVAQNGHPAPRLPTNPGGYAGISYEPDRSKVRRTGDLGADLR